MFDILAPLLKDGYKVGHKFQYPSDTRMVYTNNTARKSRLPGVDEAVVFGYQYAVEEYLIRQFNRTFFQRPLDEVMKRYRRRITNYLGPDAITFDHIEALHKLGYLPLMVKAIPEGTLVPTRVPMFTIRNTKPEFFWLTNMLETLISCVTWGPINSATIAFNYRKVFEHYATLTGGAKEFVQWQGHDFSFRGMFGLEAAVTSGAAHLLSFTGTDTIPAIDFLEEYYGANSDHELIGGSVPATEHSVMCMGGDSNEIETFRRLITQVYPKGIVSIVSDTWDFWKVMTEYLPTLKPEILARDGKVVIRPDSGDPVDIICGSPSDSGPVGKGAIHVLWEIFGGTVNKAGYKELDPHIGLIYGDSITPQRQVEILDKLKAKGFASTNVVLGIGSYTYQMNTRDTLGQAMKATYGETSRGPQNIYKDPKTDDGTKKSATGLLCVKRVPTYSPRDKGWPKEEGSTLVCYEKCSWADEESGLLQPIFIDGKVHNFQTLSRIRQRIKEQL